MKSLYFEINDGPDVTFFHIKFTVLYEKTSWHMRFEIFLNEVLYMKSDGPDVTFIRSFIQEHTLTEWLIGKMYQVTFQKLAK